jgi:hypothetical protein
MKSLAMTTAVSGLAMQAVSRTVLVGDETQ